MKPASSIQGRVQTIQIPYRRLAASPVAISVQSERITANLAELWFFPSSGCDTFLENYSMLHVTGPERKSKNINMIPFNQAIKEITGLNYVLI